MYRYNTPNADAPLRIFLHFDLRDLTIEDNVRKRLFPLACPTNGIVGLRIPSMFIPTRPAASGWLSRLQM